MTDTRYIEDLRRRYNAGAKLKFVNFWGHQAGKPNLWRGLNLLRFALMQARDTLRA